MWFPNFYVNKDYPRTKESITLQYLIYLDKTHGTTTDGHYDGPNGMGEFIRHGTLAIYYYDEHYYYDHLKNMVELNRLYDYSWKDDQCVPDDLGDRKSYPNYFPKVDEELRGIDQDVLRTDWSKYQVEMLRKSKYPERS